MRESDGTAVENLSYPFEAALLLTYHCNLHCPFCYENTWAAKCADELKTSDWLKILRELEAMQVLNVRLLGGEPLLSPAFVPLVQNFAKMKMRFVLITNGTLLDEKKIELISESRRCDVVQISLDGPRQFHDKLRGDGCFDKVVRAVKNLAEAGVAVKINAVVMRSSIPRLDEFLELLESLPVVSYRLNPLCGNALPSEKPDINELAEIGAFLFSRQNSLRKINKKSFPFLFQKWLHHSEQDDDCGGRCFRSHVQINIHPDGAVTPCPDAEEPVCGFAGKTPLADIWRGEVYNDFRQRSRKDVMLPFAECGECQWRAVCRHYCPLSEPAEICLKKLFGIWSRQGIVL